LSGFVSIKFKMLQQSVSPNIFILGDFWLKYRFFNKIQVHRMFLKNLKILNLHLFYFQLSIWRAPWPYLFYLSHPSFFSCFFQINTSSLTLFYKFSLNYFFLCFYFIFSRSGETRSSSRSRKCRWVKWRAHSIRHGSKTAGGGGKGPPPGPLSRKASFFGTTTLHTQPLHCTKFCILHSHFRSGRWKFWGNKLKISKKDIFVKKLKK